MVNKITVVGAGFVGSTIAYTLTLNAVASEILLVDVAVDKADGEAMDIDHATPFVTNTKVASGSYADSANSDIIVITAGTNQKPGETRMDMVGRNAKIMRSVVEEVVKYSPNTILLVVSNPVDVMTQIALDVSGFPKNRVIGSGTNLDSARFRYILSQKFGVDPHSINAYILGEHGDSEFPVWSKVYIGGMGINEASDTFGGVMKNEDYVTIADEVKNSAYEIIDRKGATYYGIAASVSQICRAILRNEKTILPLSVPLDGQYNLNNVYLSLPVVVGQYGIEKILTPQISEEELGKLYNSAHVIQDAYNSVKQGGSL
ncbi:MAG: L-lactate dehydrogenase [Candidatus Nomurabacteria bacterium]|jgi:L-lactate dehydrogenase|nr:L-lactate dehydrogenase [Candidatus Nomurabacteria bacterium]